MHVRMYAQLLKKTNLKENSLGNKITWSEMGKENIQAKEVYWALKAVEWQQVNLFGERIQWNSVY